MPQTITLADVRRGWIDCQTCGDTSMRIFTTTAARNANGTHNCQHNRRNETALLGYHEQMWHVKVCTLSQIAMKNNLLIISCSQRKLDTPERIYAMYRYDGPTYQILRKLRREGTSLLMSMF